MFTYYNGGKQLTQHTVQHKADFIPDDDTLRKAIQTIINYNNIVIPDKPYVTVHRNEELLKTVQMLI
jgi:hypothetical protein